MSNRALTAVLLILLTLFSPLVSAAKGVVVYYKSGCSYYIVLTNQGYALLEWFGGNDPSEGDTLIGDYEAYGMKDIYNSTADAETKVWVEDFILTKDRAIESYFEECN
ncbi:hypothetical protein BFW88_23655 [Pseudomonas fluorescens]|nr:hypothetical protein BFW88_23655 [Pseudomonas fluorescens]OPB05030.1 hypothetical protein BFW92_23600 [Pseudomonas fluorescens]OPB16332.1 hypothetical protein BFW93_23625 [Pseudomonas fluorescens]